jgi:hypothetical protein
MRSRFYSFGDDLFKIPTRDAFVIEESIIAVLMEILKNCKSSPEICAPVTDEDRLFYARYHLILLLATYGEGLKD